MTKTKYEHTEIGLIPSDWQVKCLSELGQFLKGKGIKKDEVVPDGIPCVRYGELYTVYSNKIERTVSFINKLTSKESIQLRYGDLLFAGSGESKEEIGKSAVILRNDTYAGGDIVIFRSKDIDFHFLGYLSNFTPIQKQKSLNGQGDAVVHIYSRGLSKVKIPLPPTLTEQKAIATALSDVDELISNLDKLITKKNNIKKGAMQVLLTPPNKGGKRLAGFTGDWDVKYLGELGKFLKGKGIKKDEVVSDGLPCVRYGEIYTMYSNKIEKTISFINKSTSKYSIQLHYGDLLFAGSGETKEEIGKSAVILRNDTYAGGDIVIFRSKDIDFHFLGYLSNFTPIQKQKSLYGQGDAVVHLYSSGLAKVKIPLPPTLTEQKAIAKILSDMDFEIESLEAKKEKYQSIKQGMMQELLTGKTRLI